MANQITLDFDGFDALLKEYEHHLSELKPAVEAALKAAHASTTPGIQAAASTHRRTGRTANTLWDFPFITWEDPTKASVKVGFSISGGGLASVFLMYGTKQRKGPRGRTIQDKALYNALWGPAAEARNQAMVDAFYQAMGL
jgi:hypothetical protein